MIDDNGQMPAPHVSKRTRRMTIAATVLLAGLAAAAGMYFSDRAPAEAKVDAARNSRADKAALSTNTVELSDSQLQLIKVDAVSDHTFPLQREAVGSIDFDQDMSTQVFPPYQGRLVQLFAKLGDSVAKGQRLFTIESPDLIQADSTLIAAAGVLELTTRSLDRARQLHELQGMADKDLEQAVSDQQTAEGALRAARNGVAVFGKTSAEIDNVVRTRTIDPYLLVVSPVSGRVTARNAAPGLFVQPGNDPAPYSVADMSRVWMNANVTESDMPQVRKGQEIHVSLMALPGRLFDGRISALGASVDPQLHRGLVRAEIEDPKHELLPGMFATFVIVTGAPLSAPAVPLDGVVREGDGSMTIWVTNDHHHFTQRQIHIGLISDGYEQVTDGVTSGEQIVTKGVMFLDNMINGGEG